MTRALLLALVLCGAQPLIASAQSLADVARQEEARRKAVREPGKVYTNKDLRADISRAPARPDAGAPASADAKASADGKATTDAKPAEADKPAEKAAPDEPEKPEKDEAYWRGRIGAARSALERSRIFADALQSRLNALATDFVNRDDPAQRAQIELERQRATAELARVTKEIADATKAIADIEEEARRAGVPPGWLR